MQRLVLLDVQARKGLLDALGCYHPFWLSAAAEVCTPGTAATAWGCASACPGLLHATAAALPCMLWQCRALHAVLRRTFFTAG